jgi:hypothetical protein
MLSILSQNKKELLPYKGIRIKSSMDFREYRIYNGEERIGIYPTEERALEVVQEIVNAIHYSYEGDDFGSRVIIPVVYEMPEK